MGWRFLYAFTQFTIKRKAANVYIMLHTKHIHVFGPIYSSFEHTHMHTRCLMHSKAVCSLYLFVRLLLLLFFVATPTPIRSSSLFVDSAVAVCRFYNTRAPQKWMYIKNRLCYALIHLFDVIPIYISPYVYDMHCMCAMERKWGVRQNEQTYRASPPQKNKEKILFNAL